MAAQQTRFLGGQVATREDRLTRGIAIAALVVSVLVGASQIAAYLGVGGDFRKKFAVDQVAPYFDTVGSTDENAVLLARNYAEQGSPADVYALLSRALVRAYTASYPGDSPTERRAERDGWTQFRLCTTSAEPSCVVVSDIRVSDEGLLQAFSVDGIPIERRATPLGRTASNDLVTMTLEGARLSNDGEAVIAAVRITTGGTAVRVFSSDSWWMSSSHTWKRAQGPPDRRVYAYADNWVFLRVPDGVLRGSVRLGVKRNSPDAEVTYLWLNLEPMLV